MSLEELNLYKLEMIREYIHARKGVWIEVAEPNTPEGWDLFEVAFSYALQWHATGRRS